MRPGIYKLLFLFLVFLGVTVGVAAKLIDLQILKHHHYSRLARRQHAFFRTIPAKRGTVYDRNMRQLAVTLPAYMVFADPMVLENPKDAAINIASAAGLEYRTLASRLSHRDSRFAIIDRTLDPEKARALKDMDVPGLYFEQSGERVRPLGDVGLNVLGRVSAEGEAQGGIESHYDTELRGEPGLRRYLRDAMGTPRPCVEAIVKTPVSGHSVVLAIDADLQAIAEKELDRAVLENGARGGCVVVVDPANGDILALASNPRDENFPVRTVFEPGSAFKICTIATGLDLGKVSTSSVFDTHNGILKVPGGWIRDDHPKKKLSLEEAVRRSSNVVASQVGRMIGKHDFYRSMRAFGFGSRTGIELGGEPRGIVRDPDEWSGRSLETLSIGQEIGVTAIQLTMAYAAVANGGTLLRPRLVKSIVDDNRHIRKKYPPKVVRTVVRKETTRQMIRMLQGVVSEGTGTKAAIGGIPIAGKTGTGQKAIGGRYLDDKYYSVFAGFLPAEDARYVCVVVIDEAVGETHYGGVICAPVFKEIMESSLRKDRAVVPSGCVLMSKPKASGLAVVGAAAQRTSFQLDATNHPESPVYPSVVGLTLREAARLLAQNSIRWRSSGSGTVVKQHPVAYAPMDERRLCRLVLSEVR